MKDQTPITLNSEPNVSLETYITCRDHLVTDETFDLLHDPELEMLITTPQPPVDALDKYYQSQEYISHTDSKKGVVPFLYQSVKRYALKNKVALVTKLNGGHGTILDVGAGTGDFLSTAKKSGWQVNGVEINDGARTIAKTKGVFLKDNLAAYRGEQFDVITLWHVLEHLPNLNDAVTALKALVKPGGHILIAVPNYKSYDASYYKQFWAAYDVPRHLWHFSQTSIPALFGTFNLLQIKPMIFDAVYVSMLSEKYKNNRSFSLKAICIGLWSNIRAMRTGEYSSLIYCLQKQK